MAYFSLGRRLRLHPSERCPATYMGIRTLQRLELCVLVFLYTHTSRDMSGSLDAEQRKSFMLMMMEVLLERIVPN